MKETASLKETAEMSRKFYCFSYPSLTSLLRLHFHLLHCIKASAFSSLFHFYLSFAIFLCLYCALLFSLLYALRGIPFKK